MPDKTTHNPEAQDRSGGGTPGGRPSRRRAIKPAEVLAAVGVLLGGVAAVAGLFMHNSQRDNTAASPVTTMAPSLPTTAPPTTIEPRVMITYPYKYPSQGTPQERCMTVYGTAELPIGQRLWLVVQTEPDTPDADRTFYLQGGDRAINGGREEFHGNWSEDDVFLGASDSRVDDGASFTILAVITTGETSVDFQDLLDAHAERIGSKLPKGAQVVDRVQVIRKKPSKNNCPK